MDDKTLTLEDPTELLQVSEATIRRWYRANRMPQPIRFGRRCYRWDAADIAQWIQSRKEDHASV